MAATVPRATSAVGDESARVGAEIRLEDVTKVFPGGTVAVDRVSLVVQPGELLVLVGPSGCGKTTTLRMIGGLDYPDAGRIVIDGRDVTFQPAEKRGIGIVFQSYALFPNMTVRENVGFGLRVRRVPGRERAARVDELLHILKIEELADRRPRQLSGGQQQRVALGRALAIRPPILLLDEPLTALDAKLREHLRVELLRILKDVHVTAVYVTHDQAEAMALGDRLAVMDQGRIVQLDAPRTVYRRPANAFVANFIGTSNLVSGVVSGDGRVDVGFTRLPLPEAHDGTAIRQASVVELMFRPEDVVRAEDGGGFVATVRSVQFLGDRLRVHAAIGGGGAEIVADLADGESLGLGDQVTLAVRPGGLYLLRDDRP